MDSVVPVDKVSAYFNCAYKLKIASKKYYHYKMTDVDRGYYNLENGLIILDNKGREHIRLW